LNENTDQHEKRLAYLKAFNTQGDNHMVSVFGPEYRDNLDKASSMVIIYLYAHSGKYQTFKSSMWEQHLSDFLVKTENHIRVFPAYIDVPDITVENLEDVKRELDRYNARDCVHCGERTLQKRHGSSSYHDGSRTRRWKCQKCMTINSVVDVDPWEMI